MQAPNETHVDLDKFALWEKRQRQTRRRRVMRIAAALGTLSLIVGAVSAYWPTRKSGSTATISSATPQHAAWPEAIRMPSASPADSKPSFAAQSGSQQELASDPPPNLLSRNQSRDLAKSAVGKDKFGPLYRAAKAVEAATTVGVNYIQFGELLQDFATELSIVGDTASSAPEIQLGRLYSEVLRNYEDSASLWRLKIDATDETWGDSIPFFSLDDEVGQMVTKYGLLAVERSLPHPSGPSSIRYTKKKWFALPASSIQTIWGFASRKLQEANAAFYGDLPED